MKKSLTISKKMLIPALIVGGGSLSGTLQAAMPFPGDDAVQKNKVVKMEPLKENETDGTKPLPKVKANKVKPLPKVKASRMRSLQEDDDTDFCQDDELEDSYFNCNPDTELDSYQDSLKPLSYNSQKKEKKERKKQRSLQ